MLLSRKRLRETSASPLLRGPEELLAFKSSNHQTNADNMTDGKRLLRDLVSRDAVLELLVRLQKDREPPCEMSLEMSRAHRSSQELFLSVVLEWQRSAAEAARLESPTAAVFRHDRSFRGGDSGYSSSSSSSYASSEDDERDDTAVKTKRSRQSGDDFDVSPTSVHHVPVSAVSPLRLADSASSPLKRIGIYTPRARQEMLRKYMAKRARRLSQNKVRYGVRKTLANARPRVKGRFVKTETPLTAALVQQAQTFAPEN